MICACHPRAGASLIFSVPLPCSWMIPEGNPTRQKQHGTVNARSRGLMGGLGGLTSCLGFLRLPSGLGFLPSGLESLLGLLLLLGLLPGGLPLRARCPIARVQKGFPWLSKMILPRLSGAPLTSQAGSFGHKTETHGARAKRLRRRPLDSVSPAGLGLLLRRVDLFRRRRRRRRGRRPLADRGARDRSSQGGGGGGGGG